MGIVNVKWPLTCDLIIQSNVRECVQVHCRNPFINPNPTQTNNIPKADILDLNLTKRRWLHFFYLHANWRPQDLSIPITGNNMFSKSNEDGKLFWTRRRKDKLKDIFSFEIKSTCRVPTSRQLVLNKLTCRELLSRILVPNKLVFRVPATRLLAFLS